MIDPSLVSGLAMVMVAAASAIVGVFALTRRMTLASDVLSHVALPGIGIALMIKADPFFGGAAALFLGALLVWAIERRTKIATEAIIGVIFSASLAVGSLLIGSNEELLDVLFGDIGSVTAGEALFGIIAAFLVSAIILYLKERFLLSFISADIAKTAGLNVDRLNLVFLLVFAAAVMLGLKFLGVLLTGALVIVPAAASRNLAKSFNADIFIAVAVAVLSVAVGLPLASAFGKEAGPVVVAVASAIFFLSLFFKRKE